MDACVASSCGAPPSFIVGAFCDITQRKLIVLKNHTLPSLIWNTLYSWLALFAMLRLTYDWRLLWMAPYELHLSLHLQDTTCSVCHIRPATHCCVIDNLMIVLMSYLGLCFWRYCAWEHLSLCTVADTAAVIMIKLPWFAIQKWNQTFYTLLHHDMATCCNYFVDENAQSSKISKNKSAAMVSELFLFSCCC